MIRLLEMLLPQRCYKVVIAGSPQQLVTIVNAQLDQGWRLQGGVSFNGHQYVQAMVR